MLPPVIIEQIKKREQEERCRRDQQPRVEVPTTWPARPRNPHPEEQEGERGVVIIDVL